jgi:hypothetical protein
VDFADFDWSSRDRAYSFFNLVALAVDVGQCQANNRYNNGRRHRSEGEAAPQNARSVAD